MNILITGGTGTVGLRLALLLAKKDAVFALSRREMEGKGGIRCIKADILDKNSFAAIGHDTKIDVVYHLAANMDENDPKMYEENIALTKNVIEFCKQRNVKQLVFLSSSGVLGETRTPAAEEFPYNPKTSYEKSKMECEMLIIGSGIPYTIIRASIIIAPNKIWQAIAGFAKRGFPIIGSGENKFHLSYVGDVVSLLILARGNEKAKNQVFHIATKDVPRYGDVYKMICDELKIPMTKEHKSVFMAKLMLSVHNLFSGKKALLNNATIDRLVRNRQLSIKKAKEVLGFEPKFSTQMAVKEMIKYLKLLRLGYSEEEIAEMSLRK